MVAPSATGVRSGCTLLSFGTVAVSHAKPRDLTYAR
jgi:hypothetical protein